MKSLDIVFVEERNINHMKLHFKSKINFSELNDCKTLNIIQQDTCHVVCQTLPIICHETSVHS